MTANHLVDGYHHESKTVFHYHGCHFHRCSTCYPSPKEREVVICGQKEKGLMVKITREKGYQRTLRRNEEIKADHGGMIVYQKRGMRRSLMQLYMILNPIKIQQKELW